jgi:hypothetical protein
MKRSNTRTFGEVLREYLDSIDVHHKRREVKLINAWPDVVGKSVANRTSNLQVRKRVLHVSMTSSVARSEMLMIRDGLIKALN